ncbi:serine hydrolase [Pseudohongiella sp. SYSU M77423]|uniref:serine hydrolase domain-containing protein n=1 Tax=Pseudohongiella sp. SYSU M77423 TaxID=3042312 RepID=UPI002480EEDC|nr:serine hydrolase [Pseudohongiella sp. SYSU M77423]MDH7942566.1 serine hydrolase [Pseudohongiella sp. SYSU M77423]
MKTLHGAGMALSAVLMSLLLLPHAVAQQSEQYDYWAPQRAMIQRGQQAIFMCNGLFTSERTLEQVFADELAFLREPIGTAAGGDYQVDWERRAVEVGAADGVPVMRAVFRDGIGCIILAPDQTLADIDTLPQLTLPAPPGDAAQIPWPDGDLIESDELPDNINATALQAASDWAFDRPTAEQNTISLLVVYKGQIIVERYAPGFDMSTRTRTWSTAKSIASTLIGMTVDEGLLALDEPLDLEWLPAVGSTDTDPRQNITLRHVLNMSSGLESVDNSGMEYATGSGLSYWAGASSVNGALQRALIRAPGTHWDYENYDTLLGVYAMKRALGDDQVYAEFPRRALLDRIGMRNTLISTDRFGDFVLSSQVYTNARDLARFGLLYLNGGMWNDQRLISEEWIAFSRTPAPATLGRGSQYGGQWWLVPEGRNDVPADAYTTNGNRGQYTVVVPSHDLVIVRRGLDYGRQGFNPWDLTREVIKAID